jgi:molybdenum cofactor biosynthesis enzyme
MVKAVDRSVTITGLRLTYKTGGRRGTFRLESSD